MSERWLPVIGFEGIYEVSDFGRVRSLDRNITYRNGGTRLWRGRILKSSQNSGCYPCVELCRNGGGKTASVHQLVAESFIGPRPPRKQVAHRDGNKANPALSNLRYAYPRENHADKIIHGTMHYGERNGLAKLTDSQVIEIRSRLDLGERGGALAIEFDVTHANISQIKLRRTWPHL